jgi:DNA primase
VRAEVRRAAGRSGKPDRGRAGGPDQAPPSARRELPNPLDRRYSVERDVLKLVLQYPAAISSYFADVDADDFTHPTYREIYEAVASLGGPDDFAADELRAKVAGADGVAEQVLSAIFVEPVHVAGEPDTRVAEAYVVRLRELTVARSIERIKSRLQRMNPVNETLDYNRMFSELVALEAQRRALRDQAIGPVA